MSSMIMRLESSLVEVENSLRDSTADSTTGEANATVQLFQRAEIQAFTISPALKFLDNIWLNTDEQNILCSWKIAAQPNYNLKVM